MTDQRPLPPPQADPLRELRELEAAQLAPLRALFEDPESAPAREQVRALNEQYNAARVRLAVFLRPAPKRRRAAPVSSGADNGATS